MAAKEKPFQGQVCKGVLTVWLARRRTGWMLPVDFAAKPICHQQPSPSDIKKGRALVKSATPDKSMIR
jgi:hypothetical protein